LKESVDLSLRKQTEKLLFAHPQGGDAGGDADISALLCRVATYLKLYIFF
jgi:hypothetical protein